MTVALGQLNHQRGDIFRQAMAVDLGVGGKHLGHAVNLCGGLGGRGAVVAGDQDMDVTTKGLPSGDRVVGAGVQGAVLVVCENKDAHQITFASFFSLSTSSATFSTFTPALRSAGSVTFNTLRRGVTSTPSSSGVILSIGFFFAFMMLGREA